MGRTGGEGGGARRGKKREWEFRRTRGVDGVKIRTEKSEGPGERGA
jgi:hypothetical protein